MPTTDFTGELHRTLFSQIPLDLLSTCRDRKRRRLVPVYLWLFFYAGQLDDAFPSISRLALECGMKDDDVRASISTLLQEGWIARNGKGPNGTNRYRVRSEGLRKRRPQKPTARQSKSRTPPPVKGTPRNGGGTPSNRGPVTGGGTPRYGGTINKPLNEEDINPEEELLTTSKLNMSQRVGNDSATAPQVTTAGAVATDRQIVVASDQNDAPRRHDDPAPGDSCTAAAEPSPPRPTQHVALPDCAQPHRQLLREWWSRRRQKHPDAPRELSAADLAAIHHADALGVLQPFLEHAAASGCKSLATGYRRRCEQLRAGPAATAAFEQLCSPYLAAPRRVSCQSLPAAQRELAVVLSEGFTVEQLLAALAAEQHAQQQQFAETGFAPSLPDLARWLKERRFVAYLHQPSQTPVAQAAATFVPSIDPATGEIDPFAFHRHITGHQ